MISAGRVSLCGLSLTSPHEATPTVAPAGALPNAAWLVGAEPEGGEEGGAAEGAAEGATEMPWRCVWVTSDAVCTLEDCDVHGGVRAGSSSQLAVVGCRLAGDATRSAGTGLLVQGFARCLVRTSVVEGHLRSGITVQHAGRLWCHHSIAGANALAGIKLTSRAPSVLSCCALTRNGHFGLILRGAARAHLFNVSRPNGFLN